MPYNVLTVATGADPATGVVQATTDDLPGAQQALAATIDATCVAQANADPDPQITYGIFRSLALAAPAGETLSFAGTDHWIEPV